MENLKIDSFSIIADPEGKAVAFMRINKLARVGLFLLYSRFSVICLKVIPEESLAQLHTEILKFRQRPLKSLRKQMRLNLGF